MIRIDVIQGTDEWLRARMAIPTASQFHRIITPAKMELSKQSIKYACELLAEYLLDEPLRMDLNRGIVERGSEMEQEAVTYYEMLRDVDVQKIGFALLDPPIIAMANLDDPNVPTPGPAATVILSLPPTITPSSLLQVFSAPPMTTHLCSAFTRSARSHNLGLLQPNVQLKSFRKK